MFTASPHLPVSPSAQQPRWLPADPGSIRAALPAVLQAESKDRRIDPIPAAPPKTTALGTFDGPAIDRRPWTSARLPATDHPRATGPGKILRHLLEERGLKPGDLAAVLPKSRVPEILVRDRLIRFLSSPRRQAMRPVLPTGASFVWRSRDWPASAPSARTKPNAWRSSFACRWNWSCNHRRLASFGIS